MTAWFRLQLPEGRVFDHFSTMSPHQASAGGHTCAETKAADDSHGSQRYNEFVSTRNELRVRPRPGLTLGSGWSLNVTLVHGLKAIALLNEVVSRMHDRSRHVPIRSSEVEKKSIFNLRLHRQIY